MVTVNVVKDFHPRPYGRYKETSRSESQSGACLRALLAKKLQEHDKVHVELTGFNRYGRSFLDEAFGGLITQESFVKSDLDLRLSYHHDHLPSLVLLVNSLISDADKTARGL